MDAAEKIVGKDNIIRNATPATGSEDFADMLKHVRALTVVSAIQEQNSS